MMSVALTMVSCTDDDSFTTSRGSLLTFAKDTLSLDTLFSTVPTRTFDFWVYNRSGDGLRINQVRLSRGNQTGFRVNVDGLYLDNSTGSQAQGIEVRKGDSIRVFVELTTKTNGGDTPQLVEDDLLFRLESGAEQKVNLRAWSWDALLYDSVVVARDMEITGAKPIVIRQGIRVDSIATLRIKSPATLYFSSTAGIDVYGSLVVEGEVGDDVVMRGDRLDHMFDYLPYDRVSGQWRGIHIMPSSSDNRLKNVDIHSGGNAIVCDSSAYDSTKVRLSLENVTIHNCSGYGLAADHSNVAIANTLISNTLGDCLYLRGGSATIDYATLAQFYPFDANRGAAVRLADCDAHFRNSLVTGYADDVFYADSLQFTFTHSIVRTDVWGLDSVQIDSHFIDTHIETPKDSLNGIMHFPLIDIDNLVYDFHPDSLSPAVGNAIPVNRLTTDRNGMARPAEHPTIGCYEYIPKVTAARRRTTEAIRRQYRR